ncbi:MAG: hypothetical protein WBC93_22390 [Sulfitobacter sp.]
MTRPDRTATAGESRIVIHIGTHKTATTHLQDMFFANRKLLKSKGVVFPYLGRTHGQHGLASDWIKMPFPYAMANSKRAWRKLVRAHSGKPHTVFVSSEELSRLRPTKVDMAELRQLVAGFDQVQVICTLRNQASFVQSVYQQVSTGRNPDHWDVFYQRARDHTIVDGLTLDYNVLYRHILTGFAPDEIRFLSYDTAITQPGGIVGAFLDILGADLRVEDLKPFGQGHSNVSANPLATFAANSVAAPRVANPGLVDVMARCLAMASKSTGKSTLFTRTELAEMREVFLPLNHQFINRIASLQPGFSIGPMLGPGVDTFRGRLNEAFWIRVYRELALARAA